MYLRKVAIGLMVAMLGSSIYCPDTVIAQVAQPSLNEEQNSEVPDSPTFEGAGDAYTLAAGDRINIAIFGVPEYSGEALVLPDGSLNLPTAGSVYVEGLTLQEAASAIATQYSPFVKRPHVTVSLQTLRPVRVGIAGEVNRPGSYNLSSEEQTGFPTLTEAIEQAGGITSTADLQRIEVRRPQAGSEQEQVININLWEMLQTGDLSEDIIVQGGDTIFIPEAEALDPADAIQLGSASFAPEAVSIYVVGEVTQPGVVNVPQNTPLNQAILAAGGFNQRRAERDSVKLIRLNPNGTVSQRVIPVNFEEGIDEESNPTLQNNDVIVVGRSSLAQFSDTSEQLLGPFGRIFSTILGIVNVFD